MCTVKRDHLLQTWLPSNFTLSSFWNRWGYSTKPYLCCPSTWVHVWGRPLEREKTRSGHTSKSKQASKKKRGSPPPSSYQLPIVPHSEGLDNTSPVYARTSDGLYTTQSWKEFMSASPCPFQKPASYRLPLIQLLHSFHPLFLSVRWALVEGVRSLLGLNAQSHSSTMAGSVAQHWLLPTAKKKLPWPKRRTAQVYGDKHRHLEGNLTIWPFCKITTAGSTLGPMTTPAMGFGPALQ